MGRLKWILPASLILWTLSISVGYAQVDNRYCTVKNGLDDVNSFHSLRRKLVEGFNRSGSDRACTERILFESNQSFEIQLKSPLSIDNTRDLNSDDDTYNFILDGSAASNVHINAMGLGGDECAITVNADKVKLTDITISVRKAKHAVCVQNQDFEVDTSGVSIEAEDDTDKDGFGEEDDVCPAIRNPEQTDTDGDGFGDVCDNCPMEANRDQLDADQNQVGDACEVEPSPSPSPSPSPTPSPTPLPTASPTPSPTASPSPTPSPTAEPSPSPVVTAPPEDPDDVDGDGTPNGDDNCPSIANPDQLDDDGDSTGNECDPTPSTGGGNSDGTTIVDIDPGTAAQCSLGVGHGKTWLWIFLIPLLFASYLRRKIKP